MMATTMSAARMIAAPRASALRRPTAMRATKSSAKSSQAEGKEYMLASPGITGPLGFFDPLGFCDAPTFSVSEAKRFREIEVTHGRVSMLAALGWLVAEEYHPFFGGNICGAAFGHFQEVEDVFPQFWELVVLVIGVLEANRVAKIYTGVNPTSSTEVVKEDYEPGNLGFDPLGLCPTDPEELKALQTKEINNGRLAMFAITGFAFQEELPLPGIDKQITIWKGLVEDNIVPADQANDLPF